MADLELLVNLGLAATTISGMAAAVIYMSAEELGLKNGRAALKYAWALASKVPIPDMYRWARSTPSEDRRLSEKYEHLLEKHLLKSQYLV